MSAPEPVEQVPLPAQVRALCGLARIDYADAHVARGAADAGTTPEQWGRTMLERAPLALRRQLPFGWAALGLRHGSVRSRDHVLGWPIRASTAQHLVLAARSRTGMPAELVILRDGDDWVFATLVEHDNRAMAALWRVLAEPHRRVVRHLMRSALDPAR